LGLIDKSDTCKCGDKNYLCLIHYVPLREDMGEWKYRVFQKELYNGIPNVTVWRVLRKRLERWIVCTPLSGNFFVTLVKTLHISSE
jgi:hypothetical protein